MQIVDDIFGLENLQIVDYKPKYNVDLQMKNSNFGQFCGYSMFYIVERRGKFLHIVKIFPCTFLKMNRTSAIKFNPTPFQIKTLSPNLVFTSKANPKLSTAAYRLVAGNIDLGSA